MTGDHTMDQDRFRDDVPEFVLGVLDGRSRSALLEHLATCDACSDEVESLTIGADSLMHLAARADPPLGFEQRVIERLRQESPASPRRRWTRVAAALIVVSLGVGWSVGHFASSSSSRASGRHSTFEQRTLLAGTSRVGRVYAYTGQPAWIFVSVDVGHGPARLRCVVISTTGVHHLIGAFTLHEGQGSWGVPLPVPTSQIASIELTTTSGSVVAATDAARWTSSSYGDR